VAEQIPWNNKPQQNRASEKERFGRFDSLARSFILKKA
jgi:hypothetical protein